MYLQIVHNSLNLIIFYRISASDVKNVFSKVGLNDIANVSPVMENAEMPFTTVTFSSKKSQQVHKHWYITHAHFRVYTIILF